MALNAESSRILVATLASPSRLEMATSFSVSAEQSCATTRAAAVASSNCAHSIVATLAKQASRASYASLILGVCHRSPTLIKLPSHALNSSTRDDSSTPDARVDRMRVLVRERVYIACMMTSVPTGSVDSLVKTWPPHFPTQLAHFFPPSKSQGTIALVRAIRVAHPSEGKKKAV